MISIIEQIIGQLLYALFFWLVYKYSLPAIFHGTANVLQIFFAILAASTLHKVICKDYIQFETLDERVERFFK